MDVGVACKSKIQRSMLVHMLTLEALAKAVVCYACSLADVCIMIAASVAARHCLHATQQNTGNLKNTRIAILPGTQW